MAIDRDAVLKQAEKLLRQGKLDGAIEEYVRLVEDQPRDWNSLNALGDLYARAGKPDRAAVLYTRIANHLFDEGFLPKAAALYKKALKVGVEDEHTALRLADIAARQGLFADARVYLRQLAKQRRDRGDERGALDCLVRLGSLEDADPESQTAAGRAAQALDDVAAAVRLYRSAADGFDKAERKHEALDALAEAARLDPADQELRGRLARQCVHLGQFDRARAFLSREAAGDDPDLLLMVGRIELAGGREHEARIVLTRLLTVAPERRRAVTQLAEEMAEAGFADAAYGCVELVVDDAVLSGDWDAAIAALQSFAARAAHVPALMKLVEIAVDAGRDADMRDAQARLADAYIEAGRAADARVIAEDLVAFDPASEAHVNRLRRALDLLGVADADEVIARYQEPVETFDDVVAADLLALVERARSAVDRGVASGAGDETDRVEVDTSRADVPPEEIDLSDVLASLTGDRPAVPDPGAVPAPDLDEVFEAMRGRVSGERSVAEALDQFDRGVKRLEHGQESEGIADLEAAARMPLLRFAAAARLGRFYVSRGDLTAGIDWLERAAEAPAADPDEGRAVLYELASALQQLGESARELAVLMEIEADAVAYRDVPQRIEQLRLTGGSR